jgi:hypothetical protein
MVTADDGLAVLRDTIAAFSAFCTKKGAVNEADTRAQVIDRVLQEVCGWPRSELSREEHVHRGFIDYEPIRHYRGTRSLRRSTLPSNAIGYVVTSAS